MNSIILTAQNKNGAVIKIYGQSKQDCLEQFDSQYHRSGWKINIFDSLNETSSVIKKTYK